MPWKDYFTRSYTAWCSGCSDWQDSNEATVPKATEKLKRDGWSFKGSVAKCPACTKNGPSATPAGR